MTTYNTTGTCSRAINYEVADGVVTKCEIVGGCPGNTQGVAKLVVGPTRRASRSSSSDERSRKLSRS